MNRIAPSTLLVLCLCAPFLAGPIAARAQSLAPGQPGSYIHIQSAPGQFQADVRDATLADLLKEIQARTGVDTVLVGHDGAERRITARVTAGSLEAGLHQLLQGLSYAMHPAPDGRSRVLVLLSRHRPDLVTEAPVDGMDPGQVDAGAPGTQTAPDSFLQAIR